MEKPKTHGAIRPTYMCSFIQHGEKREREKRNKEERGGGQGEDPFTYSLRKYNL